jgi:hypothetical protein
MRRRTSTKRATPVSLPFLRGKSSPRFGICIAPNSSRRSWTNLSKRKTPQRRICARRRSLERNLVAAMARSKCTPRSIAVVAFPPVFMRPAVRSTKSTLSITFCLTRRFSACLAAVTRISFSFTRSDRMGGSSSRVLAQRPTLEDTTDERRTVRSDCDPIELFSLPGRGPRTCIRIRCAASTTSLPRRICEEFVPPKTPNSSYSPLPICIHPVAP